MYALLGATTNIYVLSLLDKNLPAFSIVYFKNKWVFFAYILWQNKLI